MIFKKGDEGEPMVVSRKEYLREYFTTTFILRGDIDNLEEIKGYIIETYVDKGLLRMIKPTHSKKVSVLRGSHCTPMLSSKFHLCLAFVLRGEVRICEEVRMYLDIRIAQGLIDAQQTPYSKEKQYIVA